METLHKCFLLTVPILMKESTLSPPVFLFTFFTDQRSSILAEKYILESDITQNFWGWSLGLQVKEPYQAAFLKILFPPRMGFLPLSFIPPSLTIQPFFTLSCFIFAWTSHSEKCSMLVSCRSISVSHTRMLSRAVSNSSRWPIKCWRVENWVVWNDQKHENLQQY